MNFTNKNFVYVLVSVLNCIYRNYAKAAKKLSLKCQVAVCECKTIQKGLFE